MNAQKNTFPIRTIILIFVIAVVLVGAVSITGAAAQSSIPGDALYPVKSTIEQTRLSFSRDAGIRAQLRMSFAEQRLDEIALLIEEGRFREVGRAVLAFEADINSAILELENLSDVDPLRAPQIAREITSALTRYAQILSVMAANAPDAVKQDVTRALDSAQIAGSLELPVQQVPVTGNENANNNGNENASPDNGNTNSNQNTDDDNGNLNTNVNTNQNTNDDNGNFNTNINTNQNINDDNGNENGDDDNFNTNTNINTNQNTNSAPGNVNGDDSNSNTNTNQNTNDDNGNGNSNSNDNSDDDDDDNDNDRYGDGDY